MRHDILSDVLSIIKNADRVGKEDAIAPASKLVKEVLLVLQANKYIGEFEYIDDGKSGKFKIKLLGNVNNCGSIRPRFAVGKDEYEKYERRFLPASGFGIIVVSTSNGVMEYKEAEKQKIGGRLLVFCY